MMNKLLAVVVALTCFLAIPILVPAHHGTAGYDMDKQLVMKATVTEWLWANPHCELLLAVLDRHGTVIQ